MKYYLTVLLVGLTVSATTTQVRAAEKLEHGKDRIDTPAISSGLCVHNLFQSNMVLQRDKPIRVWGWAEPGEKVTVSFGEKTQSSTAAADRSWKLELPALPASSEPQTLVVHGQQEKIELENILVGDIWLLGGQSNMEFEIPKVEGGPLEIISANFSDMRLFTVLRADGGLCGSDCPSGRPPPRATTLGGYDVGCGLGKGDWSVPTRMERSSTGWAATASAGRR